MSSVVPMIRFKSDFVSRLPPLFFVAQIGAITSAEIQALLLLDVAANNHEYTQDELNGMLRWATGFIVSLDAHVACYPVGYPTTLLFDEDGLPL